MSAGPNNPPRADSERFQFSVIGLFGITTIAAVLAWAALQFRILPDVVRVLVLTVILAGGMMVLTFVGMAVAAKTVDFIWRLLRRSP